MSARLRLVAVALLLPLLPAGAFAASATASQNVNIRSGPAATYPVIGQIDQGDAVDIRQCEGTFCQVAAGGKTGWVSATYLTRDYVPKPVAPTPQVAALPPTRPAAQPPAATYAPPPATIRPGDHISVVPPGPGLPPAYVGRGDAAALPPRPHANIPDADAPADDDYAATEDPYAGPSAGDDYGWRPRGGFGRFGRRGMHRDFAEDGPVGDAQACFDDANGRPAFCLRDGEAMQLPARWQNQLLSLHNPDALEVSICAADRYRDCRVIVADGPIPLGGRAITTIAVSTRGY